MNQALTAFCVWGKEVGWRYEINLLDSSESHTYTDGLQLSQYFYPFFSRFFFFFLNFYVGMNLKKEKISRLFIKVQSKDVSDEGAVSWAWSEQVPISSTARVFALSEIMIWLE